MSDEHLWQTAQGGNYKGTFMTVHQKLNGKGELRGKEKKRKLPQLSGAHPLG